MKGIKFDEIHSYTNLNLVLSKVEIPPAAPRTMFVDIPSGDGSADLTESLGEVKYKDRKCKFTFTVLPPDDFEEKKTEISNKLNGKKFKITLDKDPNYYYVGRCSVDNYASNKAIHTLVVGATLQPYKLKKYETLVSATAGTNVSINLLNGRKSVVPTITCAQNAEITFNGTTYNLNAGTHKVLNIRLVEGDNMVTVTSTGVTAFKYQEGDL